jgi:transporter family-2 protein
MTPETLRYAAIMIAAGIGIPLLAALNAQLGTRVGSPAAAAVVLFMVAFACAVVTMFLTAGPAPLALMSVQPRHLFLAGILVAFYVLSITWVAPRFGVGNAVMFVLLGQLISAALIDHYGLFGALVRPLSLSRAGGLCLMTLGIIVTQRSVG